MSVLFEDRLRVLLFDGYTEVRMLLVHPMLSGRDAALSEDPVGHFIQDIRCWRNQQPMLSIKCGPGTAENPYFSFRLAGGAVGDEISVRWVDNLGEKGSVAVTIS